MPWIILLPPLYGVHRLGQDLASLWYRRRIRKLQHDAQLAWRRVAEDVAWRKQYSKQLSKQRF
jgi:hypothetical protein